MATHYETAWCPEFRPRIPADQRDRLRIRRPAHDRQRPAGAGKRNTLRHWKNNRFPFSKKAAIFLYSLTRICM
ncbi:MAG: hypothetical protein WDO16_16100 [Bacteroidota bacterium]